MKIKTERILIKQINRHINQMRQRIRNAEVGKDFF